MNEYGGLLVDKLLNILPGRKLSIRCRLFPYPEDTNVYLNWNRESNRSMPQGSNIKKGTLIINNIRTDDYGNYTCTGTAENGKRVYTAKTQLHVSGKLWT